VTNRDGVVHAYTEAERALPRHPSVTKREGAPNYPSPARDPSAGTFDVFEVDFDPKRNYLRELKDGQTKKAGA